MTKITNVVLLLFVFLSSQSTAQRLWVGCTRTGTTTAEINALLPIELFATVNVEIPSYLWFRVGSTLDTQDTVRFNLSNQFSPSAAVNNQPYTGSTPPLGNSSSISADTDLHGLGLGALPAKLQANCGQVTISASVDNASGLSSAGGNFINYDQIDTSTSNANLTPPVLANSGIAPVQVPITQMGVVTDAEATWTYTYKNQTIPPGGTYTGVVTYTASCP